MMIRAKKWKPEIIDPPEAVAVWMIIVAIGGGLLLLVIIGLVLWKVLSFIIVFDFDLFFKVCSVLAKALFLLILLL